MYLRTHVSTSTWSSGAVDEFLQLEASSAIIEREIAKRENTDNYRNWTQSVLRGYPSIVGICSSPAIKSIFDLFVIKFCCSISSSHHRRRRCSNDVVAQGEVLTRFDFLRHLLLLEDYCSFWPKKVGLPGRGLLYPTTQRRPRGRIIKGIRWCCRCCFFWRFKNHNFLSSLFVHYWDWKRKEKKKHHSQSSPI